MTEYTGTLDLPGRRPVEVRKRPWSERHVTSWSVCVHLPDLLAAIALVLLVLYLVG